MLDQSLWRDRRVLYAAAFQAALVSSIVALRSGAAAMVVARLSVQALPPLYFGAAVVAALAAPIQSAIVRTNRPPHYTVWGSLLVVFAFMVLAYMGALWGVVSLYILADVYATLIAVRFWSALGELFDAREGKRALSAVSGSGMLGCIGVGTISLIFGEHLGSAGLLIVALGSIFVCGFFGYQLTRLGRDRWQRTPKSVARFSALRSDPYAKSVALLAIVMAALTVCADFVFRLRAGHSRSEDELAALFGQINLWGGILAAAFQFGAGGWFLSRFGILRYLIILPAACFSLSAILFFEPGFWPAYVLKIVETVGTFSLQPTAFQLLYAPLPDTSRPIARAVIDGFVRKSGLALGGMALFLSRSLTSDMFSVALVAGVSAVALVLTVRLKKPYVAALSSRLARARWAQDSDLDGESLRVVLAQLHNPHPTQALLACSLLEKRHPQALRENLVGLLAHPNEKVREQAAKLAMQLGADEVVPQLRHNVAQDHRRPRYAAVRALAELDPGAETLLRPLLLSSSEPGLRAACCAALLYIDHHKLRRQSEAAQTVQEMLAAGASAPVIERRETARMLGFVANTKTLRAIYAGDIELYLHDADASVRRIAAQAAARSKLLNLVPVLIEMLGRPRERRAAREALVSYGEEIVPALASALNDRHTATSVRYELPRILRMVGGARAAEVLLFSNVQDDPLLRYRIALALSRMHRQNKDLPMDEERIFQALGRRIDAYTYYDAVYRELVETLGTHALLCRALRDRLAQNRDVTFRLLGLVYPQDSMLRAGHYLTSRSPRERALALELLDNILPVSVRQRIGPLYLERNVRLADPKQVATRLAELVGSRDQILRVLAIHTAKTLMPTDVTFELTMEDGMSESVIEKVFVIEGVDMFAASEVDDLMALAALAHEQHFEAGQTIYQIDEAGDSLFIIVEGTVKFEKDGREIVVLKDTESFGETSLLDGAPRPATAIAMTRTRVLRIDRLDFLDLVSDRPELLRAVFAAVSHNLRRVLENVAAGKLASSKEMVSSKS